MADKNKQPGPESEAADNGSSIFDLFEPPPERDPNSFGKIPVIKEDDIDLTDGASPAEVKAAADVEAAGLAHWTAPPTGQVPAVLSSENEGSGLWGDVKGPSWHGDDPSWAGPDLADVFADTDAVSFEIPLDEYDDDDDDDDDDEDRLVSSRPDRAIGATGPAGQDEPPIAPAPVRRPPPTGQSRPDSPPPHSQPPHPQPPPPHARPEPRHEASPPARPAPEPAVAQQRIPEQGVPRVRPDRPVLDESRDGLGPDVAAAPATVFDSRPPRARRPAAEGPSTGRHDRNGSADLFEPDAAEPSIDDIEFAAPPGERRPGRGPVEYHDDDDYYDDMDEELGLGPTGGRSIPKAIAVGAAMVGVLLAAMWFGPDTTLLLVSVLALLGVLELYNAMRLAGLRPATLLGIVGTVAAPAAAYYRGDAAFPLIVAMAVVFGTLWYLVGADTERPVLNLSLTMMGIFWVGGLAAFAALMLREDGGIQLLLSAILITVASDTMAYIGGRAYGSRPFHHASPNKTWEGTITGFLGAVFAGFAIGVTDMGTIWDGNLVPALMLGAVVGCLAPIGDLAESVVKRDLGIKDMGNLLPGHGGVLDRVDALLFALPGAYYLALIYGII